MNSVLKAIVAADTGILLVVAVRLFGLARDLEQLAKEMKAARNQRYSDRRLVRR